MLYAFFCSAEIAYSTKATEKSDVYSVGIVLMEVVTGLMPTDRTFGGEGMDMVTWVQSNINLPAPECDKLLDGSLNPIAANEESSMFEVLDIALQCTRTNPADRLTSRKVADLLTKVSVNVYGRGGTKHEKE